MTHRPVLFYSVKPDKEKKTKWHVFSNLFRRDVVVDGHVFPSSEHAYQYLKPAKPKIRDLLQQFPPALLAKFSHQLTWYDVNPNWKRVKHDRMRAVVLAKFTQHADLRSILLKTGNRPIIEHGTVKDASGREWGCVHRPPLQGCTCKNMLGKILMETRATLRSQPASDTFRNATVAAREAGQADQLTLRSVVA